MGFREAATTPQVFHKMVIFKQVAKGRQGSPRFKGDPRDVLWDTLMCICNVFAIQFIRAKEVRIDIEVKRSEEK